MATKRTDADHEQSSIPAWLKSTGAIVGILVALSGAIVGLYQVITSFKQFQLQIAKEERGTAEAKLKQAVEENNLGEAEARAKVELRKTDGEIKHTEYLTETEKRKALELTITRDQQGMEALEKSKIASEVRSHHREDEKQLSDNIGSIFANESPAPLAALSRYAKPGGDNVSIILTPLVAKLDEVVSPAQVNIIFQLFNKSGPGALNSVLDSNRNAFEKYKKGVRDLARIEYAAELQRLTDSGKPSDDRYAIQRAVSQRITSAYVGNPGLARLTDRIVFDLLLNSSPSAAVPVTEEWELLVKRSRIQLDILSQSKRSLLRLVDPNNNSLDLSGMDLTDIKFPRMSGVAINFRGACLIGADLSQLALDRTSLLSLLESEVGQYTRFDPTRSGGDTAFLDSLFRAVHLSNEQKAVLSSSSNGQD